jgi:kynurenine formamidase
VKVECMAELGEAPGWDAGLQKTGDVLRAINLVRRGLVFDLDIGRFPGMTRNPAQPPFDVVTYRSPRGLANEGREGDGAPRADEDNFGFLLELVTTSMHMGTHIDALCHVTAGKPGRGYGDFRAEEDIGDKGALRYDITTVPPIVARGVLLDVAGALGVAKLEPGHEITLGEVERAIAFGGAAVQTGDVVLVRTGHLRDWPELEFGSEPGLGLEAAVWLAERGPFAIGADNSAVEVIPSRVPRRAQPVHVELIAKRGIYLIEWVGLERLAASGTYEFCFIALPLKISGASGSLLRPVAMA